MFRHWASAPRFRSRSRRLAATAAVAAMVAATALGAAAPAPAPLPARTLMSRLRWRQLGPAIGGRVVAVAGVPSQPDLFYMGATGGGVWRSTDYGLRWVNISDHAMPTTSAGIGALAVAPSNPKILYAGTGECDIRNTMIPGDGLFRSSNAGGKWRRAGLAATHTICALAVDPRHANVVFAASLGHVFKPNAARGVFQTTDGGRTWRKVLYVNDRTGAVDVVMDPRDPRVLYAAMWQAQRTPWGLDSGGPGSGLYKTTDGGAHWANLTRNAGLPAGVWGRSGVSIAASDPQVVYAIIQARHGGIFRSADGGRRWRRVNRSWALRQRAFYYMSIYADPTDPNTVYVPEVDALWVSHDGAKTFHRLHTPHGDNHIVWINPRNPKILLEGNDGGATISTDGGRTWSSEHNQFTAQFYHLALDRQFPFHVYGAQQDERSMSGPSAAPGGSIPVGAWRPAAYGEASWVAPEPGHPNVTFGSGYFSIMIRADSRTGQLQGVSPWPDYQEGSPSAALKYRFGWSHPILFSPANPHQLLTGAQYVLSSLDGGRSWRRISPDLTRNDPATEAASGGPINIDASGAEVYPGISALAVSPLNGRIIWAGTDDGRVQVTTNGGRTWRSVRPPQLPKWSWVSCIEPSFVAPGTAFLTARRYMWDDFHPYAFVTHDFGRHWQTITQGLPPNTYLFAIRQDPRDARLLFLAGSSTVYVSLNGGEQWQPLTLNLPVAQVRDIRISRRQGQVVIATHGRAMWALDQLSLLEQLAAAPIVTATRPFLFAPQRAWLSHVYGRGPAAFRPPAAGTNPAFGAAVFFHIPANYDGHTPVTLTFRTASGQVVRSFHLHLATRAKRPHPGTRFEPTQLAAWAARRRTGIRPGMNRFLWDLRYAPAVEVTGFEPPIAAGGEDDTVQGPVVTPGRYTVTLDYGGRTSTRSFAVSLDPRLHATPAELAARLALQLRIRRTLDALDRGLNQAIRARAALEKSGKNVSVGAAASSPGRAALAALDAAIARYVQLKIHSSEGSLLEPTRLRSHLGYLAADIGLAYVAPNRAQYAVFRYLQAQAQTAVRRLDAEVAAARKAAAGAAGR